ncbi:glycosyltransferase [Oricola cellulosilytica]|uniref:Glycosyltransferase n=1 Tax=Oricola cellulosilytica TaxID=1429082 RepID=A0A4R0P736_9HYPH|nr:glycosyltransferase [Oricola cellulosilytica]TCD11312.1 glycosyltransferase [Oricola cellulosilytica]
MKVLHVFKTYLPEDFTGIPRVIHAIAEGLTPLGVESHVFALSDTPDRAPAMIGSHHLHVAQRDIHIASTSLSISAFYRFRDLARDADVVHYHFPWPMGDLLHFLHGRGKPTIITYHSDIVRQRLLLPFYRPIMHRFLSAADAIVATSPNYMGTSPVLERHRDKVSIIPIGLPERTPPDSEDLEKWRRRLEDGFFLFVGDLRYYKGLPFLIEAARRTSIPVVVAGQGAAPDAPDNVKYVGAVSDDDREALLSLCRAFVFPSHLRSEAFGVALLEAARAGKPMISCEIGTGTSYVNIDQLTGLTIPPADAEALSNAMRRLAKDADMATAMGKSARMRYDSLFQIPRMLDSYRDIYCRVTNSTDEFPTSA